MDKLDTQGLLLILILIIILWGIRTSSYSNLYLVIPVILLYQNIDIKICIGVFIIWLFLIFLEKDNRIHKNIEIEGFKNNKLKKLKTTHIGKTSERFANVLMSRGKKQKNKESFNNTTKNGKIDNLTQGYAKYKESFKPIFKKPSKTTGEAIYKGKLLWKKLKEIF